MKDYAAMSDQQINQLVGTIISRDGLSIIASDGNAVIHEYSDCGDFKGICLGWRVFDPCNNPADAWLIITEYRISIIDLNDKEWGCRVEGAHGVMRAINENPLRCAMVVFLMMKDGE